MHNCFYPVSNALGYIDYKLKVLSFGMLRIRSKWNFGQVAEVGH